MSKKIELIFSLTNEFHIDIDNIYEHLCEGENQQGFSLIDELRKKLKVLKDNLIKKEEI